MQEVYLLTIAQKDSLVGQKYCPDSYFNPFQDLNNNWVLSQEEVNACVIPEFNWVKSLTKITFVPKVYPSLHP